MSATLAVYLPLTAFVQRRGSAIQVGDPVAKSPVGTGRVTGFDAEGTPQVSGVSVNWLERPDGARWDPEGAHGGTTPAKEEDFGSFSWALRHMSSGRRLTRPHWVQNEICIFLVPAGPVQYAGLQPEESSPRFCIKVNGRVNAYAVSADDCLAEDWTVFERRRE